MAEGRAEGAAGSHEPFRIYPPPYCGVERIYGDLSFPESTPNAPDLPYVLLNMVSSLDGKVSVQGKSGAIGSRVDRETMRVLRSKVDAVMVGAGTLRAEKVSLVSEGRKEPEPKAIIVTGSLDVPLENLLDSTKEGTLIMVPKAPKGGKAADEEKLKRLFNRANILYCETDMDGRIDFTKALVSLKDGFHVNSLLLEGGPSLSHALVSRGLVSEIFLTLSPKLLGGSRDGSIGILNGKALENAPTPKLISMHKSDPEGELLLRYRVRAESAR